MISIKNVILPNKPLNNFELEEAASLSSLGSGKFSILLLSISKDAVAL